MNLNKKCKFSLDTGILCFVLFFILQTSFCDAQSLEDLDTVGGSSSYAYGINDLGQVVGGVVNASGDVDAFLYSNEATSLLPNLGVNENARAINNAGEIVGGYNDTVTGDIAFVYSGGVASSLGTFPGGDSSDATDINDAGQISGYSTLGNGQYNAFVYSNGTMSDLGTISASSTGSYGLAINKIGQVAGSSDVYDGQTDTISPVIFQLGSSPLNLGSPFNSSNSGAEAINSSGQIAGYFSDANGKSEGAFIYSNGIFTDLGSLGAGTSIARGINDSGEVIGSSTVNGSTLNSPSLGHAFVYTPSLGMQNLNTLFASDLVSGTDPLQQGFVTLLAATAINNSGAIAGYGTYWDGISDSTQAFLLTAAPEPSTWSLALCALIGVPLAHGLRRLIRIRRATPF